MLHHPFQWGLGAARLAGLGPPTNSPWPRATFSCLCGLWLGIEEPSSSQTTIATSAGSSGHGGCAGNNFGGAMPPLAKATGPYKDTQGARAALSPAQEGTMRSLVLLTLLALLTVGLCRRGMGGSRAGGDNEGDSVPWEGLWSEQRDWEKFGVGGTGLQQRDKGAGYPSADWGGLSEGSELQKECGESKSPQGLPEPTHASLSLTAADGSTSTNDSPSSEGE